MKRLRIEENNQKRKALTMKFNFACGSLRHIATLVKGCALLFLIVLFVEIWIMSRLSTYGGKLQDLKEAQVQLSLENQEIESQIAQQASLNVIEKKAQIFGFGNIKNIDYPKPVVIASSR